MDVYYGTRMERDMLWFLTWRFDGQSVFFILSGAICTRRLRLDM